VDFDFDKEREIILGMYFLAENIFDAYAQPHGSFIEPFPLIVHQLTILCVSGCIKPLLRLHALRFEIDFSVQFYDPKVNHLVSKEVHRIRTFAQFLFEF
jgi:hypothetical protein